ncbi:MAG: N-acetyltransferase, partial [Candidatus Marinimicrobia bacterium]|nr:N-acetyltransferase [Candidatus Neomarinimicrobiota bacterium]MBT4280479.1 N-acetyltransferase [Candidatus Neomarinimicrobiota bacterium]MBT4956418.1 N-acetyltransferase [Candidatus Neomarinimicrobiota bacterium]MBT7113296.1 N-acetyltransferase [Candidatus Neomarinimicrobiota bacterium]MBT7900176.1 N-acetyltransferase [Candidatus Neomarinimicrobiota bacterium]
ANATIVCGVTIGEYAMIGSGAVVTKDVPAFALIVGNPGRVVGKVDKKGERVE